MKQSPLSCSADRDVPAGQDPPRDYGQAARLQAESVLLLRLVGALDASNAGDLDVKVQRHVEAARTLDQCLVLDLADVTLLSGAAAASLDAATHRAEHVTVTAVAPNPQIRTILTRALLPTVRVHTTITEALTALNRPATDDTNLAAGPDDAGAILVQATPDAAETAAASRPPHTDGTLTTLREEIYGLRARARSRGLIDLAQGIVLARYRLPDARMAFTLLKEASQAHNVPLRVFASAVVAAPAPVATGSWFPGRRSVPPPAAPFLTTHGAQPHERGRVLQAVVEEAVALTGTDAGALHLADLARGGILYLEADHGHSPAYRDAYARVTSTVTAIARARATGHLITDVQATRARGDRPVSDTGFHTIHAAPLTAPDGQRTGALSVQHNEPGHRLAPEQEAALLALASETAAWQSWYQRTVLLNALEQLHARATAHHN